LSLSPMYSVNIPRSVGYFIDKGAT
jgi:hypothetical protein